MGTTATEEIKRELWFWYFTQILYKNGTISDAQKLELEKKICLNT